ncbi:MAG: ribosome recycling factor [Sphingobacteriaceae bacterium]|nr:ribosome recycling factor [Sphingobacteriaceae bacterium]
MSDIKTILESAKTQMEKTISHLESELAKIRAGKANPAMLDNIFVDYYGAKTTLGNVASVNTQDSRTILVQPWEKSMLTPIEKAIQAANLGFNPQNDGVLIRIIVPPLTEERRKDLVKTSKSCGEDAKVSLRTIRKESIDKIKALQKAGLPEDEAKSGEAKMQTLIDEFVVKCEKHLEQKEKEILTV